MKAINNTINISTSEKITDLRITNTCISNNANIFPLHHNKKWL